MKLVIVHNHFRPGGVRRVIELGAPDLVRRLQPPISEVVLAGGEPPDASWWRHFRNSLGSIRARFETVPAMGYLAEQRTAPENITRRLRHALARLTQTDPASTCLVWAHNQGLARNPLLTRELQRVCAAPNVTLLFHHHDWWFDNRWNRWPELRRAGSRTLPAVARVIFGAAPNIRHVAINQADAAILRRHFRDHAGWLPNPSGPRSFPSARAARQARAWLRDTLDSPAPVWLIPCRLLRRKNIAEALLLARWLRPEAWLVTTGSPSSDEEKPYAAQLERASARNGWQLRLGVLGGSERNQPAVADLLAASEAVLLTSLQEGFGLPFLEAADARRPLLARALPNIMPDLARFGLRFPHLYAELWVDPTLFDWPAESARQRRAFSLWRKVLPAPLRRLTGQPWLFRAGPDRPVPFSRLTLAAQLQVLQAPLEQSWERCAPLNPFLSAWRRQAQDEALGATGWPQQAEQWLAGPAYAERFQQILNATPGRQPPPNAALAAQEEFIRLKLATDNLYPLMWSSNA